MDESVGVLDGLWMWLEALPLSARIGESAWFPFLESIHVVASTFLFGSILMLDLRLLGRASVSHRISRIVAEIVPWTLAAALLAVLTGFPLFSTRATHYAHNIAFQIKIVLLLLAATNMLWYHLRTARTIASWDTAPKPISAARFAGMCSVFMWIGVMLSGRWVGHLL
ncbi:MAG: hypothetical protein FJW27_01540 [Acidimicrobiia bacterium]|nr:hypothetical protein [Acidimicrobiia bacterium]